MNENTATQPVVELKDGALMGRIKDAVYLFSGIPYAAPPVGPARFKAAQPVQPWDGIRDATKFGPAAPQIPSGGMTDRVPEGFCGLPRKGSPRRIGDGARKNNLGPLASVSLKVFNRLDSRLVYSNQFSFVQVF